MTQEDKELLLKDLCARLPYEVKLECKWKTPAPNGTYGMITKMDSFVLDQICNIDDIDVPFDEVKPFLFPLSSMTMEQAQQWHKYANDRGGLAPSTDWLNANHFDYRDLIPMGLAIDATDKNIY